MHYFDPGAHRCDLAPIAVRDLSKHSNQLGPQLYHFMSYWVWFRDVQTFTLIVAVMPNIVTSSAYTESQFFWVVWNFEPKNLEVANCIVSESHPLSIFKGPAFVSRDEKVLNAAMWQFAGSVNVAKPDQSKVWIHIHIHRGRGGNSFSILCYGTFPQNVFNIYLGLSPDHVYFLNSKHPSSYSSDPWFDGKSKQKSER